MRYSLLLVLIPLIRLAAADFYIDHVTVAGTDLKKMQASLAAAGIRSEYGGPHSNHATEMALTSFPDGSYLELIAIQRNPDQKAVAAHYWSARMQKNAGPTAWAIRSTDVAAEVKRLNTAGVVTGGPTRAGRKRPGGVKLEWEAATVGSEPNGMFFPFLIHDFTPREQRVYPSGKPTSNDFAGIVRVVIAVNDMKGAIERYRRAYDLPAPRLQDDTNFGAHLAEFEGAPVILASSLNDRSWLFERIAGVGEGPCAFVLRGGHVPSKSTSQWFGKQIQWFDEAKLGWRLGAER